MMLVIIYGYNKRVFFEFFFILFLKKNFKKDKPNERVFAFRARKQEITFGTRNNFFEPDG